MIIKSKLGYKFGGYTTQTWEIINNYKGDKLAFLFSLNKQKKYNHIQNLNGYNYFAFVGDHNLYIYDQCTSNNKNYCSSSSYNTTEQYELNGGEQYFYVDELEVYNVEFE